MRDAPGPATRRALGAARLSGSAPPAVGSAAPRAPGAGGLLIGEALDRPAAAALAGGEGAVQGGQDVAGGFLEAEGRVHDDQAGAVQARGVERFAAVEFEGEDVADAGPAERRVEGADGGTTLDRVPGGLDEAAGAAIDGG
jgi:hypothetical protein